VASRASGGQRALLDVGSAVDGLLRDGFAIVSPTEGTCEASRAAFEAGRTFFSQPERERAAVAWSGRGEWAGYQPVPEGDVALVDLVERFEAPASAFSSGQADQIWPPTVPELRPSLGSLLDRSIELVEELILRAASQHGHGRREARFLWVEDHASTVVVNHYPDPSPHPLTMKPHRDFGGLTALFFEGGTATDLELEQATGWTSLPATTSACVMVGELLAAWLGCPAPLHRVRTDRRGRVSLVVFHQPALDRVIPLADGSTVVAGEHIATRQAFYNGLDGRYG